MEENKDNGTEEELKIQIDESMFVTGCMGTDNRMKRAKELLEKWDGKLL